ncbi:helix-turn-helix domain-containing protein [Chakrabartyella piscis]|uniref:helix-turn-helix domain-containing protein n=1 Tax=Chakrabartyella piscis TaxID=2918914 RepID=UPI0029584AF8|nr:helix-turn-helix domain-containing protein [Chakrabartyella piscis]
MTYQECIVEEEGFFCRIFYVSNAACKREMQIHKHPLAEFALVVSGTCTYQTEEGLYTCKEGDFLFFASNKPHYIIEIMEGEPFILMNVQVSASILMQKEYVSILKNRMVFLKLEGLGDISREYPNGAMVRIGKECSEQKIGWEISVKSELLHALSWVIRYHADGTKPLVQNRQEEPWVYKVERYVEAHIAEELDLETLAKEAGFSRTYFCAKFHQYMGVAVWEYVTEKRMAVAMKWLVATDVAITEVALIAGFQNPSHFYRIFKKRFGVTPASYRSAANKIIERA